MNPKDIENPQAEDDFRHQLRTENQPSPPDSIQDWIEENALNECLSKDCVEYAFMVKGATALKEKYLQPVMEENKRLIETKLKCNDAIMQLADENKRLKEEISESNKEFDMMKNCADVYYNEFKRLKEELGLLQIVKTQKELLLVSCEDALEITQQQLAEKDKDAVIFVEWIDINGWYRTGKEDGSHNKETWHKQGTGDTTTEKLYKIFLQSPKVNQSR